MRRRDFLSGLVAAGALAGPALAESVVDSVVSQLRDLGFQSVTQERTLLGRVRIVARREDGQREIIINPRTGEILRDLWTPAKGGSATSRIIKESAGSGNTGGSGGGQAGGSDDEDDDEDDGDDEDDDDGDDGEGGDDEGGDDEGGSSGSGGGDGGSGGDDDDDGDDGEDGED
jgi:hypothetical protein